MGKPLDDDKEMTYDGLNYDVRKTKSLSAPYDLILSFYLNTQYSSNPIIVEYSRKEGVWDLKNVITKNENVHQAVGYFMILNGLRTFESNSAKDSIKTKKNSIGKEDSKIKAKDNSGSFPLERGSWKVQKFETKKNGEAGAYFDGENIKILIFKNPGMDNASIRIILQGDQKLIENDILLFFFDNVLPAMPILNYSNYEVDHEYWGNIHVESMGNTQITTTLLKANDYIITKIKKSNELFIMGGTEYDISTGRGYAIRYRIPLKNSTNTINKAFSM